VSAGKTDQGEGGAKKLNINKENRSIHSARAGRGTKPGQNACYTKPGREKKEFQAHTVNQADDQRVRWEKWGNGTSDRVGNLAL